MRVPPYAYGQIDPLAFLRFCYIERSVRKPKSKSAKTNCGEVRVFPTAHRTKPCTPQTDHKNLRVRRCVRVVPTRHSRPLSHAQRRTQFPLANMVRARTSLGASSRAAGGRGDASRLASRVQARFRASRSVSAFHRALATRAIGIARGRRRGDARRGAAAATGSSVCHVAVAASRPALARSPRGRGGVPSRGPRGGPLRVFLCLLADDDARLGRAPSLFVSRRLSDLFLISPCLSSPSSYPHSPLRSRPPRPRR